MVLGDIHLHFAWQAWHLWHWAGFGGALGFRCDAGRRDSFGVRHGTWRHLSSLCVAGVALRDTFTLRGRRGTWLHTYRCIHNLSHTTVFTSRSFSPPPLSFLPSRSQLLHAHTHTRTHTHTSHTTHHHTTYSHLLFHTQLTPPQSFTISFLFPTLAGDIHTDVYITFPTQLFLLLRSFSPPPLSFLPSRSQLLHAHTHIHTHAHTPHTQLITTQLTHTYSSTHNLLHPNPSPSLFSFLLSTCHLYVSFAACWKKLTCGVIRSFNWCCATVVCMCWDPLCIGTGASKRCVLQ